MKLNPSSKINLDIKTIIIICSFIITCSGMWYGLKAEIAEAKELPVLPISEGEIILKDLLIRETIMNNAKRLEKIEKKIDKIDEKLYNLNH
tara:strand:- start:478 stop:750 length:273 start_codon:yes stop_codon:yes gene_type:complete